MATEWKCEHCGVESHGRLPGLCSNGGLHKFIAVVPSPPTRTEEPTWVMLDSDRKLLLDRLTEDVKRLSGVIAHVIPDLRAMQKALTSDTDGQCRDLRKALDKRDIYNGDIADHRCLDELAKAIVKDLRAALAATTTSPGAPVTMTNETKKKPQVNMVQVVEDALQRGLTRRASPARADEPVKHVFSGGSVPVVPPSASPEPGAEPLREAWVDERAYDYTKPIPVIDGKCSLCGADHDPNKTLCPNAPIRKSAPPSSPERERAQDTPTKELREYYADVDSTFTSKMLKAWLLKMGDPHDDDATFAEVCCVSLRAINAEAELRARLQDVRGWLLTDRNVFDSFVDSTDARVREGVKTHLEYLNSVIDKAFAESRR